MANSYYSAKAIFWKTSGKKEVIFRNSKKKFSKVLSTSKLGNIGAVLKVQEL